MLTPILFIAINLIQQWYLTDDQIQISDIVAGYHGARSSSSRTSADKTMAIGLTRLVIRSTLILLSARLCQVAATLYHPTIVLYNIQK